MKEYFKENAEHVLSVQNEIGEAPLWIPEENRLYWTDTENSCIFNLNPSTSEVNKYELSMPVTSLVRRRGGGWVIITKKGLAFWDQMNNQCEFICDPVSDNDSLAFNDGTVDSAGRLLAGTMNFNEVTSPEGCLFSLNEKLELTRLDSNLCTANGMSFSPDGKILYVSEQWNSKILCYDYDSSMGTLSNRRIFAEVDPKNGYPDGIIIDNEGYLWNGRWGAFQIVRYSPDGKIDRKYNIPVETSTCVGFGGKDLSDLYISTAWYGKSDIERQKEPYAGDLFRIKTDVKGRLEPRFAG
ncbi:SMP-30/gluconolactonase/LRE family protein [Oceanispirochaeta sp.]|jgi:L-arabinonolactonase|uniref:SMP-30/gluconolactonase/LRE family protein n=1 Tax=Oceanispirochaeta sp. TaxID=2035350 RepID=UPI00260D6A55|nr:SMP-30/gluconolactonase/LRE family protein [Oceanispirochaeta sp.]MDA3958417.1 SMP-30/gluconolactonase/LRE family protein [Oceanispirochaeta sp.]